MISRYSSAYEALKTVYPSENWNALDFYRVPQNMWKCKVFQRQFLDRLEKKLSITSADDWSKISQQKIKQEGGSTLLKHYNNSIYAALTTLYPERTWVVFDSTTRVPKGFWDDIANHQMFLDWFAKKHNITSFDQWNRITADQIKESGGTSLLSYYSSFFECLTIGMILYI